MNKERIELRAKAKLEDFLGQLGYLTPELSSNDKTPSWDGFVRLYNNEETSAKANLVKRIPVQLKGHFQNPPYNESITYEIEVDDLKNYLNDSGVIFFVVYVGENDFYKIYYNTLTPLKIRRLLKGKEKQKTISVYLQSFPQNNKKDTVDIFYNFIIDMEMSLPKWDITIEDAFKNKINGYDNFSIKYIGIQKPYEYFFKHPVTVALQNSSIGMAFPVDTLFLLSLTTTHRETITVAGEKYYDAFKITRQKDDKLTLQFGKSLRYNFQKSENTIKANFHFDIKGNLSERITDTRFLLAYLENKYIEIAGCKVLELNSKQIETIDTSYLKNSLKFYENVNALLMKLKVQPVLDYDRITENEGKTLAQLVNTVLLGATCVPEKTDVLYKIQIANIRILLIAHKIDDNKYTIINYFTDENKIQCAFTYDDKIMFKIPKTFILSKDDFCTLDNIDYDMVYRDIANSQISKELKEYTYYYMQKMIEGYKTRTKEKKEMYECIKQAITYLKKNVKEFDYTVLERKL